MEEKHILNFCEKQVPFRKEINNVRRVREQVSKLILGTSGEVSEEKDAVKERWGEYFEGLLNENNISEAAVNCLRRGGVKECERVKN